MEIGEGLKALSEPTRLSIVQLLLERQHCSRSLALALGISESAVSQHMAVLKECGLVHGVRRGYRVHYVLDREAFESMAAELSGWVARMGCAQECGQGSMCAYRAQGCCCATHRDGCWKIGE